MSDRPLTERADGVWTLSYELVMGPGARLPCNSTLLRADDDTLVLISPGPLTDEAIAAIQQLGTVSWVVAPNLFHHLYLGAAQQVFSAKVMGPHGLKAKQPDLTLDGYLGEDDLPPGFDVLSVDGMNRIREYVVYHRASNTLVATDLMFNLDKPPGFWSRVMFSLFGTYNGAAMSRLVRFVTGDKPAFLQSMLPILDLNIDLLVVAHGEPLGDAPKQTLRAAVEQRFGPLPSPG